jgi:hypothetical protein
MNIQYFEEQDNTLDTGTATSRTTRLWYPYLTNKNLADNHRSNGSDDELYYEQQPREGDIHK